MYWLLLVIIILWLCRCTKSSFQNKFIWGGQNLIFKDKPRERNFTWIQDIGNNTVAVPNPSAYVCEPRRLSLCDEVKQNILNDSATISDFIRARRCVSEWTPIKNKIEIDEVPKE